MHLIDCDTPLSQITWTERDNELSHSAQTDTNIVLSAMRGRTVMLVGIVRSISV